MRGAGSTIVSDVGVMMAIVGNEGPMSCGHLRQSRPGHHLYQGLDKTKNKKKLGDVNKKIDRDNNNNDTHTQHQIIIKIITNDVDGHTYIYVYNYLNSLCCRGNKSGNGQQQQPPKRSETNKRKNRTEQMAPFSFV